MSSIIYWKSDNGTEPTEEEKYPLPGDWVCNDERVRNFRIFGTASLQSATKASMVAVLNFKNGEKKEFPLEAELSELGENVNNIFVSMAEEYLQSLEKVSGFKFYNQAGEEVKERPDGWAINAANGSAEELETLIKLLKQFDPIKLKHPTDVEALRNIDFGNSGTQSCK